MDPTDIGWQSWSLAGPGGWKFPLRNFSPFPNTGSTARRRPKKPKAPSPPLTGWCSWHAYGPRVTESNIVNHARFIKRNRLPISYILVDDGWAVWGDWLTPEKEKFPNGMRHLAKNITQLGFLPGIWMAPFLSDPHAKLLGQHPSWFVRTGSGALVDGRKITPFDRFLPYRKWIVDFTNPEAQSHISRVIDTLVADWGYRLLKLDFLYAQHFNPKFTTSVVPDRLLRTFLKTIKNRYPHVHIAACGSPLVPAVGVCDSMRISDDIVIPLLRGLWPVNRLLHTYRLKQLRKNLHARHTTRRYWQIDPDAFVCHPKNGLSQKQVRVLRETIREADGLRFLGDDLLHLDKSLLTREVLPLLGP
ncbi:MAG: Glycosyl hydrolases 31 family protein [Microgenomates group bacterium GW2011_GWC1_49_7]|nr:MAG: Glycosyl hydrolases 31 family protein [Microgenomates group bacterium GW2011_GWC1_49_7]